MEALRSRRSGLLPDQTFNQFKPGGPSAFEFLDVLCTEVAVMNDLKLGSAGSSFHEKLNKRLILLLDPFVCPGPEHAVRRIVGQELAGVGIRAALSILTPHRKGAPFDGLEIVFHEPFGKRRRMG